MIKIKIKIKIKIMILIRIQLTHSMNFVKLTFILIGLLSGIECRDSTKFGSNTDTRAQDAKTPRKHIYKGFTFISSPIKNLHPEEIILQPGGKYRTCETSHNYKSTPKGFVCVFNFKEKVEVSLHFENFNTEEGYDFVYLTDEHNSMITMYHGNLGSFWSEPVTVKKMIVRFNPDSENNFYGFKIDRIMIRSLKPPRVITDTKFTDVESSYESEHDVTIGPGKSWKDEVFIKQPGAEEIHVHFSLLAINSECRSPSTKNKCQASIKVYDHKNVLQKEYNQSVNLSDQWLEIKGDKVHILFEIKTKPWISGGGVMGEYGYKIDRLRVKSIYPVYKYVSKYPIVFAHGLFGFNRLMGFEYFFRVRKYLQNKGYEVYMTEVPPVSSLQIRADHLARQINAILRESSKENGRKIDKINFIAHSMGGLDGRVLISENTSGYSKNPRPEYKIYGRDMGDKFASFTTIGTPHHGSYIADILQGLKPEKNVKKIAGLVSNVLSAFYNYPGPTEDEIIAASFELTQSFCEQFNIDHHEPKNKGIKYRAFAGVAQPTLPEKKNSAEVIPVLLPTLLLIQSNPDPTMRESDGVISFKSARWNDDYYSPYQGGPLMADHLAEVGQILGQTDPKFNYLEFYYYIASTFQ